MKSINRKSTALVLLSVVVIATVAGSLVLAMESNVETDANNIVASEAVTAPTLVNENQNGTRWFNGGFMDFKGQRLLGRGFGGPRGFGGLGGFGSIQVSTEFTENVTNIAKADADVQNLLENGYNVTIVRPIITTVIDGNGNVVTKASTAELILRHDTAGIARVLVDLDQAKVTKIVTLTRTVIDKP